MTASLLPSAATREREVRELITLAAESLGHMRTPTDPGVFCFELRAGEPVPHGRSLRYTLMALLGLQKALLHGHAAAWDLTPVEAALRREIDSPELDPGDLGLYLWAAQRGAAFGDLDLVGRLERALDANGGLGARLGMELGWIVTGLAHHVAGGGAAAEPLLHRALHQLLDANQAPSGLFRHLGDAGLRRRFPNFATQIYSVLALATVARYGLDPRAAPAACKAADRLLELQLPDGGWPWLYDAERGTVVERYEVYCVHQHAMAPMGLLELAEATGDERYVRAVGHGLSWIHGANELGRDMVLADEHIILRSIRRRAVLARAWPALKSAASLAGLPADRRRGRLTEVDPTDRPYSMGWILEAWSGREAILDHGIAPEEDDA